MIRFAGFGFRYPESASPALSDVSLELPSGALALVTGASGAGKSTMLRALNGLVPHFTGGAVWGTVRVGGRDPVAEGPPGMSAWVGFVAGDPEGTFALDIVADEVALALEPRGLARSEQRRRVSWALDSVGLGPLANAEIASLSAGERQRVAVASALALAPAVVALDEPTSQIDDAAADLLLQAVVELSRSEGLTVVVSEHRVDRILPYASHIVHMPRPGQAPTAGPAPSMVAHLRRPDTPLAPDTARSEVLLAARDLRYAYGDRRVLEGASLDVHSGEVVALAGPSGSGKSTLLKLVVGLLRPAAGTILVAGAPAVGRSVAEICRQVGYLPQDPSALLFADSVRKELLVTLDNHGLAPAAGHDPDRLLTALDIRGLADRFPRDLSTGQRQRAAIGAIAITDPAVLMLDEPTRGLDDASIASLARLLHERAAAGAAVLVATHDRRLARSAHRVVLLRQGRIEPADTDWPWAPSECPVARSH